MGARCRPLTHAGPATSCPLWCTCRPPGHGRGIARYTDRDVEFELGRDKDGKVVMVVVKDEVTR
jgi:hypothetical protein